MNLPRIRTTLLAACTAALLVPAAAQAATISHEGGTLVYRGEGSEGLSLLLTSSRTALEGGDATAVLKLSAKAKRAFKKLRRTKLTVKVTVKPAGGKAVTGVRSVTLER